MQVVGVKVTRDGFEAAGLTPPGFWLHRHNASASRVPGRSRITEALRAHTARDSLLRMWGRSVKRNGLPIPIVSYPSGWTETELLPIRTALEELDSVAGLCLPETVTVTLQNPTYASTISIAEALHYMDALIRYRITLAWNLGTIVGRDTVYNAAADARDRPQLTLIDLIRRELAKSASRQLLTPIMRANWGPKAYGLVKAPVLAPDPATSTGATAAEPGGETDAGT